MYIFDFFVNIFKKKNFGVLIWLIINSIIVSFGFAFLVCLICDAANWYIPDGVEYLIGFVTYVLSIVIALSPIGETILRWQNGCKEITDENVLRRIEPLFNEIHLRAVNIDSSLKRDIRFFISDDEEPNAFATGRNTVCITEGLLMLSNEEIKGVLAHEFGHLSHKDTDAILVVAVGNLIVSVFFIVLRIFIRIINVIVSFLVGIVVSNEDGFIAKIVMGIKWLADFLIDTIIGAMMWLWTKLGVLICLTSSRQNEYHADKFAVDLNYKNELISALTSLDKMEPSKNKGLWAALNSSHPETSLRIEKLQSYGHKIIPSEPPSPSPSNKKPEKTGNKGGPTPPIPPYQDTKRSKDKEIVFYIESEYD